MIRSFRLILLITLAVLINSEIYSQKWGAYTFYAPKNNNTAFLVDTNGNTFHTWNFSTNARSAYSSYLLEGGTIVRTVANVGNVLQGGGVSGKVQKVNFDGNVIWDYTYSSANYVLHHDICPMPNGNILMISYDVIPATEVTASGASKNILVWSDKIIEVKPTGATTGEIVWEWRFWDHLCQNTDPSKKNYVSSISDNPQLLNINYKLQKDWLHANGIDYNAELDQIAISSHNMNEIYIIDHSTTTEEAKGHSGGNSGKGGDFLYRWGNPTAYSASGTTVFKVVHDVHWIPNGSARAGYLVGFNNNGISTLKSSVDMFYPPYDGYNYKKNANSAYEPLTYAYRHSCNGNTSNEGNSQQLPNGNMMVCISLAGLIYEVDSLGNMLWSKQLSSGGPGQPGGVTHAYRYSECYVKGTIAPKPTISKKGEELEANYGVKFQWFLNGEPIRGANEQKYYPTQSGKYYVQVYNTEGCESYLSDAFKFEKTVGIDATELYSIELINKYDNNFEIIGVGNDANNIEIKVFDMMGKNVCSFSNQKEIELQHLPSSIYVVSIVIDGRIINKKISIIK